MAKTQKTKSASSKTRNPERPNGKAWKKPRKPKPARTPEAELRYFEILKQRMARKDANILRRRLELEKAQASMEWSDSEEKLRRNDPIGVMTRKKRKKVSSS